MIENHSQTGKRKNTTRVLCGIVIALVIGIIGVSLYIVFDRLTVADMAGDTANAVDGEGFDGAIAIDPPREMPDFTLTNQDGEPTSLSDWRGKYVLLAFGYTHSPDVGPLTMNEFGRIRNSLGDLAENVEFVFISVDSQRDTPDVLKQYFETLKIDGIIGLTGSETDLRTLGADYGLSFEIEGDPSQGDYFIDHTAGSFLLNPDGQWIMRYQLGALPSMIAKDLETFIASSPSVEDNQ